MKVGLFAWLAPVSGIALVGVGCGEQPSTPSTGAPAPVNGVYSVQIQSGTSSGVPACNSKTAGETAFVTSTATLESCVAGVWVPIACVIGGGVAFDSATDSLWACTESGDGGAPRWAQITLPQGAQGATGATGPQGPAGTQGSQGDAGPPGPAGTAGPTGPQGPQGDAGANALIVQTPFAAGAGSAAQNNACPTGGTELDTGTNNGAGGFAGPVSTTYVCNGELGEAGATGAIGPQGPQGDAGANALVVQTPFAEGAATSAQNSACPTGGTEFDTGTDDGTGGFVGPVSTTYVCNGASGGAAALTSCTKVITSQATITVPSDLSIGYSMFGGGGGGCGGSNGASVSGNFQTSTGDQLTVIVGGGGGGNGGQNGGGGGAGYFGGAGGNGGGGGGSTAISNNGTLVVYASGGAGAGGSDGGGGGTNVAGVGAQGTVGGSGTGASGTGVPGLEGFGSGGVHGFGGTGGNCGSGGGGGGGGG